MGAPRGTALVVAMSRVKVAATAMVITPSVKARVTVVAREAMRRSTDRWATSMRS
jgi:hypothetical protein